MIDHLATARYAVKEPVSEADLMPMIDYGAWKAFLDAIEDVMRPSPLCTLCEEVLPLYRECLSCVDPRQSSWRIKRGLRITGSDIQMALQVWAVRRFGFYDAWMALVAWSTVHELARGSERRWYLERLNGEPVGMSALFQHLQDSKTEWELKCEEGKIVLHGSGWESQWYLPENWWQREPESTFYRRIEETDEECLKRLEQFYRKQRKELKARIRFQNGGLGYEARDARFMALRLTGLTAAKIARHENLDLDRKHIEKSIVRFANRLGLRWPPEKWPEVTDIDIDEEVARHYADRGIQVSVHALRTRSAARRLGFWDFGEASEPLAHSF